MIGRTGRQVIYRLLPGESVDLPPLPPLNPVIPFAVTSTQSGFMTGFEEAVSDFRALGWDFNITPVSDVRPGIGTTKALSMGSDAGASNRVSHGLNNAPGQTFFFRLYFKLNIFAFAGAFGPQWFQFVGSYSSGGSEVANIGVEVHQSALDVTAVHLRAVTGGMSGAGGGVGTTGAVNYVNGVWYRLEVYLKRGDVGVPNGHVRFRTFLGESLTPLEDVTSPGAELSLGHTNLWLGHAVTAGTLKVRYLFDDIICTNLEMPGPGTIHTLKLTGTSLGQWTPITLIPNHLNIDHVPGIGVDLTDYVTGGTPGLTDRFIIIPGPPDLRTVGDWSQLQISQARIGTEPTTVEFFQWDNLNQVWTSGVIALSSGPARLLMLKWNDVPDFQLSDWNLGYTLVTIPDPVWGVPRIYEMWFQVNVRPPE